MAFADRLDDTALDDVGGRTVQFVIVGPAAILLEVLDGEKVSPTLWPDSICQAFFICRKAHCGVVWTVPGSVDTG
jgi:hypothetical protein